MSPDALAEVAKQLGAPHLTLTWEDLERFRGPIIYIWTRSSEVLYVGLSFNGVERPLATTHARLRHFQPGDRVTIWRAPADPVALYDLEAVLIRALRPRYNVAAKPCQTCGSPARAGAERCVACARRRKNVEALQVANVEAALRKLGEGAS
jgi:hypothetical protein